MKVKEPTDVIDAAEDNGPVGRALREGYAAIATRESPLGGLQAVKACAAALAPACPHIAERSDVSDAILEEATRCGLVDEIREGGEGAVLQAIRAGFEEAERGTLNGHGHGYADAVPTRRAEQGKRTDPPPVQLPEVLPLTIAEWEARDLPPPDLLLGDLFSTTSRAILNAPTGLGKTMFAIAIGLALASGSPFLHWAPRRPARVLYIDGEMSRRLLRQRIADAAQRHGAKPETFFALSHEDIEGFAPLNTPQGQACIDALVTRLGRIDFVIFDSVMCLTVGDMKDGELWGQVMPWARSLTRRAIGQLWIHHTGHDETRGYGDKTREWQMDAVIHLEPVKQEGIDVSFNLTFRKARERTPSNRHDFQDAKVLLAGDVWQSEVSEAAPRTQPASPTAQKFLDALRNVLIGDGIAKMHGRPAAHVDAWKAEAVLLGLIDKDARPDSARSLFSKYRRELVAANLVACENDFSWIRR